MKNPTLLQCFHWYYPAGGELWREVTALAPNLNEIGINMIWLPPACKGASGGYWSDTTLTIFSTSVSLTRKAASPPSTVTKLSCWRPSTHSKVMRSPSSLTWWLTTKWAQTRKNPSAFSASTNRIARRSTMRSLSVKPGHATPSCPCRAIFAVYLGLQMLQRRRPY